MLTSFVFQPNIKINGVPAQTQLRNLFAQSLRGPSTLKKVSYVGNTLIGVAASLVYIGSAMALVQDANPAYAVLVVSSGVSINAILNIYFNLLAVRILFSVIDPITSQLTVSKVELAITLLLSIGSAFPFAFLSLQDKIFIPSSVNFPLQLFCFTTQHFIPIMAIVVMVGNCRSSAHLRAEQIRSSLIQVLNKALITLENPAKNLRPSLQGEICDEKGLTHPEKLAHYVAAIQVDEDSIMGSDLALTSSHISPRIGKRVTQGVYYLFQALGTFIQVVANVGYINVTFTGFNQKLAFSRNAAWALTITCMSPPLLLSFMLSHDNIKKISELLSLGYEKASEGTLKCALPKIEKNFCFQLFFGALLTLFSVLSFGTSVQLFKDALSPINPENPPQFAWMLTDNEILNSMLIGITAFGACFFNIFPVPEVVESSQDLCSSKNAEFNPAREALQYAITTLEKTPEIAYEQRTSQLARSPRKSFCESLMGWFCSSKNNEREALLINEQQLYSA